jgi:DNA polymerase III sliding clamp (beta) subunit (PCNA family)
MTLSEALEAALTGQVSPADVIAAIDSELGGNVTVLVSKAYKAAAQAMKQADKPNKSLPVTSHMLIQTHNGQLLITPFAWEDMDKKTEAIPARVEAEFSTCVPAKQFTNWLKASQLTTEEKRKGASEQVNLTFDPKIQSLTITAGNTRAVFYCLPANEFPKEKGS